MRLAIISDIHSDLASLNNALHAIEKRHCDRLVCLGDIVGCSYYYQDHLYGRNPDECVRLVRENCNHVIAGNHDLFIARRMPEYFNELNYPADWCSLSPDQRKKISGDTVWLYDDELPDEYSSATIEYLASLPETMVIDDGSVYLSHYLFPDLTGSTKAAPNNKKGFTPHLMHLDKMKTKLGLVGHAHPDGYAEISYNTTGVYGYRKNTVTSFPALLIVPAVTRGDSGNGFMIIDTGSMLAESISLE
jgi:predicted phosphodiesterase